MAEDPTTPRIDPRTLADAMDYRDAMIESRDMATQMLQTFKGLSNILSATTRMTGDIAVNFTKMAEMSKEVLSNSRIRQRIDQQIYGDIESAEAKIAELEFKKIRYEKDKAKIQEAARKAQANFDIAEDSLIKARQQHAKKLYRSITDEALARQMIDSATNELDKRAAKDLLATILIERQESEEILKTAKDTVSATKEMAKIKKKEAEEGISFYDQGIEKQKKLVEENKKASIEIKRQQGFMSHLKDSSYEALGGLGKMIKSAEEFAKVLETAVIEFVILEKILASGFGRFEALDKAAEEFRKQTGFSNTQMVELRKNAESINVEFQDMGVGINEVYASAKALTDVFGRTSLVSREAMQNVSLMSVNLGVAVEDSAAVLATFQGLGDASQEAAMNVMKVGAGFSEKAGVPFSLVMKDIANAASDTLSLLGANPTVLMKSAIAARALGTDLNKLVSSQRKLLEFSTSMNDELTLSALLGKNVSFQEARRLAILGKTEDAAKATLEIVKAAGDFDSMNYIQREQLAKAAGMELKDLTKMLAVDKQRLAIENGSDMAARERLRKQDETLRLLAEQNDLSKQGILDAKESEIRQQKMQGQMTKLKNIMESLVVSIGDILEPIITLLSDVVVPAFGFIAKFLKATFEPISWISKGIKSIATDTFSWSETLKNIKEQFVDFNTGILTVGKIAASGGLLYMLFAGKMGFGKLTKAIKAPFTMVKNLFKKSAETALDTTAESLGRIPTAESVKSGTGIKDFLSNLATGLKDMGVTGVARGAVNLGLAAIAFVIMTAGIIGLGAVALLGEAAGIGLTALSIGLSNLANPLVLKGTGILALVSLSFIGLAYAGKLAADAFVSIAKAIPDAIGPFIKFALISPLLYAAAGAVSALSLSLVLFAGASVAGKLTSFFTGDPFEPFQKLANLSDKLKTSADAMKSISIAAATFTSINAFADSISKLADSLGRLNDQLGAIKTEQLSKLSQIASATTTQATNTAAASATLNTSGVEDKLDKLTSLLVGGAVRVYLNGKLVNSAMAIDAG
jgi:hypothetical protein